MEKNNTSYHIPVLFQESIDALDIHPDGVYVDVTFGGGGHARAIFDQLNDAGQLIVFDQDADAKKNAWQAPNFHFVAANFAFLKNHLQLLRFTKVNGILADLGVSSHQFDTGERGFSIRESAPLDMRMNQQSGKSAAQVINEYEEHELIRIFRNYGELKNARAIAAEIVRKRSDGTIETTGDLMKALNRYAPKFKEHKFYAQVFQAVRIEVNQELQVLEDMLTQAAEVLAPGGRLVVISYHSLEDRLVKNFMKRGSFSGEIEKDFFGNVQKPFTEIVRHPIVSTDEENERNPRARSAKLRIAEKNA
ncbi:MAG: 16S rRNA (cytosine(1402)-N(4))-methyltransferase RsmH [Crocinitomicaceae bacterium]|jgi:16S rRNA (cytosine1402-N4)-methyltransferase|nr:16S rRNA (cytosine(1402)-N(4))-methyltransferase RsmH [Crocinitomicaceae bacterium]MDP4760676.1 16S rRNA (cytosine(1402)-N(4))-methyltransferase RsmH [Crocinitomicaceae bacterium]